jgi:hypothetical protein
VKHLCFIFLTISPFFVSAQGSKTPVILNLDTCKTINRSLNYRLDTILIIRSNSDNKEIAFHRDVDFYGATFKSFANFSYANFADSSLFFGTRFLAGSQFYFTKFDKNADFDYARFDNMAFFYDATFRDAAHFFSTSFPGTADFQFSKFSSVGDFSSLRLTDQSVLLFHKAFLPALIDFSENASLRHVIDFTDANFSQTDDSDPSGQWHYINLYDSDIPQIKIDYQHFRLCFYNGNNSSNLGITFSGDKFIYTNKVYPIMDYRKLFDVTGMKSYLHKVFPTAQQSDIVIQSFLIDCLQRGRFPAPLPDDETISTYEKVLKKLDTDGQKISYETLDIEYRDFKNGWFVIPHLWYCYGYHKEWIFLWSTGFLLLFTVITFFLLDKLNNENSQDAVYQLANIPNTTKNGRYLFFSRLWYSLMYTSMIFFLLTLKIENLNFKKGLVMYVLVVYSAGLLCLGYMANFILQK